MKKIVKIVFLFVIAAISVAVLSSFDKKVKVEEKTSSFIIGNPIYHLMLATEAEESWPAPAWTLEPTPLPPTYPLIEDVKYYVDMGLIEIPVEFIIRWKNPQGGILKERVYLDGSIQYHSWTKLYSGTWPLFINGLPNDAYMEVTWQNPANKPMNILLGWHENGSCNQEVIFSQSVPNLHITHAFLQ